MINAISTFMLPTVYKDGTEVTLFCDVTGRDAFDQAVAHIWAWISLVDALPRLESSEESLYLAAQDAYDTALAALRQGSSRLSFLATVVPRVLTSPAPVAVLAQVRHHYQEELAHA